MTSTIELEQVRDTVTRLSEPTVDSAKRFGGLVVLEYLIDLIEDSPKELFNRLDLLAVLDAVKKDKELLPEAPGMKSGRSVRRHASARTGISVTH
jgi:hypothetical protein